jgi:small conductance mechanosensitive channel
MLDQDTSRAWNDLHLLLPLIITNVLHLLTAIGILIIGFWIAGRTQRLVMSSLSRTGHVDQMLPGFLGNIVRYFILTVTVLAVLSQFGIQTTSLVTVLGAAGLAIGLALQGTLSQLAAGVMLLIFRPFRIGHHVLVGGVDGTVRELSLFWTEVVTGDNVQVILPNGSVWGQPIRNFSVYPQPVATTSVRFRLPDVDLRAVREKILTLLQGMSNVLKNPAPGVTFDRNATDNALEVVVTFAPEGGAGSSAAVKSDVVQAVHDAFAVANADASAEPSSR